MVIRHCKDEENKKKLKELASAIVKKAGDVSKEKLSVLITLSEIEHFKRHGKSYTGLYFVKLKSGPVIAFFDEVIEDVGNFKNLSPSPELEKVIEDVLSKYGDKSEEQLSELTRKLPAYVQAKEYEPIFVIELAIEKHEDYMLFLKSFEEEDEEVPKHLNSVFRLLNF